MNDPYYDLFRYPKTMRSGYLNLDQESAFTFGATGRNPLLDPIFCDAWIEYLHRKNNLDFSYGGYLENRAGIWRGSYIKPDKSCHLGIDINVPVFTEVWVPKGYRVAGIFIDDDNEGGWGTRVTLEVGGKYVVFAHIDLYLTIQMNGCYTSANPLGRIAAHDHNGGWFPHLHLQGLKDLSQLNDLDGYGPDRDDNEENYPNPIDILT